MSYKYDIEKVQKLYSKAKRAIWISVALRFFSEGFPKRTSLILKICLFETDVRKSKKLPCTVKLLQKRLAPFRDKSPF
jgi:hypothetical protein